MRHATASFALAALFACDNGSPPTARECPLPDAFSLAAGDRILLDKTEGVALEGTGGLVVEDAGAHWRLRAPYEGDAGLRARCANGAQAERAVSVAPLSFTLVSQWQPGNGPPAREYFAMWLDESDSDRLLVFGGFHYVPKPYTPADDLWELRIGSGRWRELSAKGQAPLSPGGRVAPLPGARAVYFFGGATASEAGAVTATGPTLSRLDYAPDRLEWSPAPRAQTAPGSYTGGFVRDTKRNRLLSIGGADASTGFSCDVSGYTEEAGFVPVRVAAGPAPKGRYGFHYAYDGETDRIVLYGGQTGAGRLDVAGDTWALELSEQPPRWVKLADAGEASPIRRNGAWALDEGGHRLFVWGGTSDGSTAVPGVQVLNLDRGHEAWTNLAVPAEVPARASGMAVYDRTNGRLLLGFGNTSAKAYTDLWELSLRPNAR